MQYKINQIDKFLKEGMRIKTNSDGNTHIHNFNLKGEIGEIIFPSIYIFNNAYEGRTGTKDPQKMGYKYSWVIMGDNPHGIVEFLNEKDESIYLTLHCSKCDINVAIEPDKINNNIISGRVFCEECKNKFFVKCINCNNYYDKKSITKDKRGYNYCEPCYGHLYAYCSSCEEECLKEQMKYQDGKMYCQDCFSIRFGLCEICNHVFYLEKLFFSLEYNITYCNNCNPKAKDVRSYGYRPNKWEFKQEKYETKDTLKLKEMNVSGIKQIEIGEKPLFIGVELEVEPREEIVQQIIDGGTDSLLNEAHRFKNFLKSEYLDNMFYLKYDSSVRGFEIVTHPFSLKYSHNNLKWDKILKWLVENNFTSYLNERCGLHVHLDKNYFNQLDLVKLRIFFSINSEQLFKFSKRTDKSRHWALNEPFDFKKFQSGYQSGRHWALNINTDKNTAEIRIFRGTLNYERFIASLQFAEAVSFYVKQIGIGFLINDKKTWEHFIDWCKQETSYNHFVKYVLSTNHKGEK